MVAEGTGINKASSEDFVGEILPSGTFIIAKGATEAIIRYIAPDSIQEENETFNISFADQNNQGIIREATTKITIVDDDLIILMEQSHTGKKNIHNA